MNLFFNKRILNNNLIKKFIDIQKNINGINYNLIGIINIPTFDHFTVIKFTIWFWRIIKLSNYYYDDLRGNDNIKKVSDLNEYIKINYPLCLLYLRNN